ncbi:DUF7523 family protein [Halovivax gelatinilyticus]|uniref:DUF7523 family protein n=1 Tax=Halovivax gelatinilyticus TaxID=2961597 RepID=UPI0020CA3EC2|nr:hypothetical protein [Halovivax gelatinilyticus]
MSLAAETRDAVDEFPFLVDALRADICNYTAVARFLDIDGEVDAVSTALRRYAAELPEIHLTSRDVRVTMQSGIETIEDPDDALVRVGDQCLGTGSGDSTAILATGDVDAASFGSVLDGCRLADVAVSAAAFIEGSSSVVVVDRRDGANALRVTERAFDSVTDRPD